MTDSLEIAQRIITIRKTQSTGWSLDKITNDDAEHVARALIECRTEVERLTRERDAEYAGRLHVISLSDRYYAERDSLAKALREAAGPGCDGYFQGSTKKACGECRFCRAYAALAGLDDKPCTCWMNERCAAHPRNEPKVQP